MEVAYTTSIVIVKESSVGRSAGFEYFQPPVPQTYRSSYSMPFAVRN
jgi:hypothetical protein